MWDRTGWHRMPRRTVTYGPSRWPHRLRNAGAFRTVHLNVAGWSMVLAPGAAAGAVAARLLGHRTPRGVLVGAAVTYTVARVADVLRWRASPVTQQVGDRDVAERLAAAVAADGVPVEVADLGADHGGGRFGIRYLQRHAGTVDAVTLRLLPPEAGRQ